MLALLELLDGVELVNGELDWLTNVNAPLHGPRQARVQLFTGSESLKELLLASIREVERVNFSNIDSSLSRIRTIGSCSITTQVNCPAVS
jgi:hypothetical protein